MNFGKAIGRAAIVLGVGWAAAGLLNAQGTPSGQSAGPPLQLAQPAGQSASPVVITLQDALDRARKNDAQFHSAMTDAQNAHEDTTQAKSTRLPSVNESTQYLGTQGDGTLSTGRFVTNDGIHVYREWGIVHEDINSNLILGTGVKRAQAAEALAKAKVDIAQRGLTVIVTRNYYALVSAQRKYGTAQEATQQAQHFLDISQQQENLGQVAHSDVVKAEIQYQQTRESYQEAELAMESARLNLAVLLFPTFDENFTVVDDLDSAQALPAFPEIQRMAEQQNPDIRVASAAVRVASLDVQAARSARLPSLSLDGDYGIEANSFALRSIVTAFPDKGPLPNLGYFITANLSIPVWDWGTMRSKVHQSEQRQQQAQIELTQAQRQVIANLYSYYDEAIAARAAVDTFRRAADLAVESLRLINLRYQAGESTALEVVDAQNTLVQARNAYDDALNRLRIALATLQTLTGTF